ncbi:DUF6207 family protein [Streptomyces sp. NPDC002776]
MDPIHETHVREQGLVVVDIAPADDRPCFPAAARRPVGGGDSGADEAGRHQPGALRRATTRRRATRSW